MAVRKGSDARHHTTEIIISACPANEPGVILTQHSSPGERSIASNKYSILICGKDKVYGIVILADIASINRHDDLVTAKVEFSGNSARHVFIKVEAHRCDSV
jgi:hypothetical protein